MKFSWNWFLLILIGGFMVIELPLIFSDFPPNALIGFNFMLISFSIISGVLGGQSKIDKKNGGKKR